MGIDDAFKRLNRARAQARSSSSTRNGRQGPPQPNLDPTDSIFGVNQLVHYAGFASRSIWRRKFLVVIAFVLTFSMVVAATKVAPRTYHTEVTMLTQTSIIIASLINPSRVVPYDVYAPTRAAAEMVLRRDNVISLIRQTDLLSHWDRLRSPLVRLADRGQAKIRGRELSTEEKLDQLVEQIERRMVVYAQPGSDGVVMISLDWPDPETGYYLVLRAQESFLQARQVAETQAISEALKVLDRYQASVRADLQTTLDELVRTNARVLDLQGRTSTLRPAPTPVQRVVDTAAAFGVTIESDDELLADPGTLADPRLSRLKTAAESKRTELARLEADQRRKLDQLNAELSAAKTIYTANHPTVQSLQQSVSAFHYDSPQVVRLRQDLDQLETEADEQAALAAERLVRAAIKQHRATVRRAPAPRPAAATPAPAPVPANTDLLPGRPRPEAVAQFAMARVRTQLNQLHGVLERTETARIELDIAKAAFKHRYSVVYPAEQAGDPSFPIARRILFAGLFASVFFALAVAIAADIAGRRILEPWQVQRQLGLRVLGVVKSV